MKTRLLHRLNIVIGVLITLPAITWIAPAYASSRPPSDVIKEAQVFVPNAVYKYTTKGAYVFGRNHNWVFVDIKTGRVYSFIWPFNPVRSKNHIDQKTAETRIRAWLADRKIELGGWLLLGKKIYSGNINRSVYNFEFGKKTPDGEITLPSRIIISIDSDGNLGEYSYMDSPVTVSLKQTYSKEELMRIAFKATRQKNAKLKSYRLYIGETFGDVKKQMLLAEIWLRGAPTITGIDCSRDDGFIINAHTGKVIGNLCH